MFWRFRRCTITYKSIHILEQRSVLTWKFAVTPSSESFQFEQAMGHIKYLTRIHKQLHSNRTKVYDFPSQRTNLFVQFLSLYQTSLTQVSINIQRSLNIGRLFKYVPLIIIDDSLTMTTATTRPYVCVCVLVWQKHTAKTCFLIHSTPKGVNSFCPKWNIPTTTKLIKEPNKLAAKRNEIACAQLLRWNGIIDHTYLEYFE